MKITVLCRTIVYKITVMYTKNQIARAWDLLQRRYEGSVDHLHFETFYRILETVSKKETGEDSATPLHTRRH